MNTHATFDSILALNQQIQTLIEDADWQGVGKLDVRRKQQIQQFFSAGSAVDRQQALILQQQNNQILQQLTHKRTELGAKQRKAHSSRRAVDAYLNNR